MELLIELLVAELVAIAIRAALVRLFAWLPGSWRLWESPALPQAA